MNVIDTKPRRWFTAERWFPEGTGVVIGPTIGLLIWMFGVAVGALVVRFWP